MLRLRAMMEDHALTQLPERFKYSKPRAACFSLYLTFQFAT